MGRISVCTISAGESMIALPALKRPNGAATLLYWPVLGASYGVAHGLC